MTLSREEEEKVRDRWFAAASAEFYGDSECAAGYSRQRTLDAKVISAITGWWFRTGRELHLTGIDGSKGELVKSEEPKLEGSNGTKQRASMEEFEGVGGTDDDPTATAERARELRKIFDAASDGMASGSGSARGLWSGIRGGSMCGRAGRRAIGGRR